MQYYAGIDVGGTKVYAVVIDEDGCVLGRAKIKIGEEKEFEQVLQKILDCYQNACKKADVEDKQIPAIGLAVPSSIDRVHRVIKYAPNLGWVNLKFSDQLTEAFGKPFFVDNDVNMGTFGEYHLGVAKDYTSVYGMFVGTGLGGGYIFEGQVVRGVTYTAGEIGHTIVKMGGPRCNCGNRGCLEAIAAKVGMIKYMKKQVDKRGKTTALEQIAPNWRNTIGSSALRKAFDKRDDVVYKAMKRSAEAIGVAAGNVIGTAGVDAIVLGGGVIEELSSFFLPAVKKSMLKHTFAEAAKDVALLESKLGDDAVALGAAWFVRLPEKQDMLFR
ncbi:MAG: ROK family protein [bacterium]|nr:ROK family protein [bacterium]